MQLREGKVPHATTWYRGEVKCIWIVRGGWRLILRSNLPLFIYGRPKSGFMGSFNQNLAFGIKIEKRAQEFGR